MDIRKRSSIRPVRESELPVVPTASRGEQKLGTGKGQCFHQASEEGKRGDCRWGWKLRRKFGNFRGSYTGRPSRENWGRWFRSNLQKKAEFWQFYRIRCPIHCRSRHAQIPRYLRSRIPHLPHCQLTKQSSPPRYPPLPTPRPQFLFP